MRPRAIERLQRLADTGIDFLTIHGRTLRENKTKVGPCHVSDIRSVRDLLWQSGRRVPIVANGGIEFYPDVARLQHETKAAAVMSSEGLLERPDLFQETASDSGNRAFRILFRFISSTSAAASSGLAESNSNFNAARIFGDSDQVANW